MKIQLKRIRTPDQTLQLIQDAVQQAFTSLQGLPFVGGQFLAGKTSQTLALTAGQDNVFTHTLGYIPKVVLPFAPNVQAAIWVTSSSRTSVTLRCSANCSVQVWVA